MLSWTNGWWWPICESSYNSFDTSMKFGFLSREKYTFPQVIVSFVVVGSSLFALRNLGGFLHPMTGISGVLRGSDGWLGASSYYFVTDSFDWGSRDQDYRCLQMLRDMARNWSHWCQCNKAYFDCFIEVDTKIDRDIKILTVKTKEVSYTFPQSISIIVPCLSSRLLRANIHFCQTTSARLAPSIAFTALDSDCSHCHRSPVT